jgi:hypothetical protein
VWLGLHGSAGKPGVGSLAVLFEVDVALDGVVHRLDDLADRLVETGTGTRLPVRERGTDQRRAVRVEERLGLTAGVSLVGERARDSPLGNERGVDLEHLTRPERCALRTTASVS